MDHDQRILMTRTYMWGLLRFWQNFQSKKVGKGMHAALKNKTTTAKQIKAPLPELYTQKSQRPLVKNQLTLVDHLPLDKGEEICN